MRKLYAVMALLFVCMFSSTAFGQITGSLTVCQGSVDTLHATPAGGSWSSSNPGVATINAVGIVTGISAGTSTISYSLLSTPVVVTVNPLPAAISGSTYIPCGSPATLTDATPGGTWSSANPAVVTVSSSGIITPVSYSSTIITYTLPTGCYRVASVGVYPTGPSVLGPTTTCVGGTMTLSGSPTGGTWSASGSGVTSVSSGGLVTGVVAGFDSVLYTISTGCGPVTTAWGVTVTTTATAGTIYGTSSISCGSTSTLTSSAGAGTWTSSNPAVATIGATSGVLTGVSVGTAIVTFTITTSCGTASTTRIVNVSAVSAGTISYSGYIPCGGTPTLTSTVPGGTWSSSAPGVVTIGSSTGLITTVSAGGATITYTVTTSCGTAIATTGVGVTTGSAGTLSGPTTVCVGGTITLSSSMGGGSWSGSGAEFSVSSTGVVTGVSVGTDTVWYSIPTPCGPATSARIVTVLAAGSTGPLGGPSALTCGSYGTKTCSPSGGTWSSSTPSVLTISSTSGLMTAVSVGTSTISYTVTTSCGVATTTAVVTVSTPTISASVNPMYCSPQFTGMASGAGSSYTWTGTGLSCTACAYPTITPTGTTTYTVTGCGVSTTVTVTADRVLGHVTFSGTTPSSPALKVWLIQYNPADSSIVATDSTVTCNDSAISTQYYQFNGQPAGNYLVKAKLISAVPGGSGYIPTYGASTPNWFSATNISHVTGGTNVQDINMIYGTVPAGPGFISGYVYAGAGKGTSTGVSGMLIYLKSATTGQVLSHTYTDGGGAYSFGSLANGSYVIYPEAYDYYTTPSAVIVLGPSSTSATNVIFRQFATSKTIVPSGPTYIAPVNGNDAVSVHPNPSSGSVNISWQNQPVGNGTIVISDMLGREVFTSVLNVNAASGVQNVNLDNLTAGIYIINVKSSGINYTGKLLLEK